MRPASRGFFGPELRPSISAEMNETYPRMIPAEADWHVSREFHPGRDVGFHF